MTKHSLFTFFLLTLFICCKPNKDEVTTLSVYTGNNSQIDTVFMYHYFDEDSTYIMARNAQGQFKNSFELDAGFYILDFGSEYATIFLDKGYDLSIEISDFDQFDECITAKGKGQNANNFLFEQFLEKERQFDALDKLTSDEFDALMSRFVDDQKNKLSESKMCQETTALLSNKLDNDMSEYELYFKQLMDFKKLTDTIEVAPNFSGKDIHGNVFSLSDFHGKLVYIDVWASWCAPCIHEAPYFKQLQTEYIDNNIQFLSISMDCPDQADDWKRALENNKMVGTQLIADSCFESSIAQDYYINSLPRFILVDEKGYLIDINAPRPSSATIRQLIDSHLPS